MIKESVSRRKDARPLVEEMEGVIMARKVMTDDEKRAKAREFVVRETMEHRDGKIEVLDGRPLRARIKPRVIYRSIPKKGSTQIFSSEADAKRWIDEHDIGGNPNGFLYEMQGRKFGRRGVR